MIRHQKLYFVDNHGITNYSDMKDISDQHVLKPWEGNLSINVKTNSRIIAPNITVLQEFIGYKLPCLFLS